MIIIKCPNCKKIFKCYKCELKKKRKFCKNKCRFEYMKGMNNPNYNNKWTEKQKKEMSNKIKQTFDTGRKTWNKGLTEKTDKRVKQYVNKQRGQLRILNISKETKRKQRLATIKRNLINNVMWRPDVRKKVSESNKGRTPWNKGIHAWYVAGKFNPHWKGDDYLRTNYRGPNWKFLRKEILKRDNHKCQSCGENKKQLVVHHIKEWSLTKDNNEKNLITLCRSCHGKQHFKKKKQ